ncbi:MAG: DUF1351 domain-containing protein [Lachnotalea sp.]
MSELKVVVDQQVGAIKFNYEEIKENLAKQMDLYKDATFTEETKQIAKGEVATLRKIKKAIDDKRKDVKNQCLVPYKDFETKANDLIKIIDAPIELIDKQITAFDEKKKAEKRAKIQEIYTEIAVDVTEYLTLEKIYNTKWENTTTSIKSITEDITGVVESTIAAITTIQAMNSEVVDKALDLYKKDLSLTNAITYINKYEQQKAEIIQKENERRQAEEERKKQAEIEKAKTEERERIERENRIREEERVKAVQAEQAKTVIVQPAQECKEEIAEVIDTLPFEQPSTIRAVYSVVATKEELVEVEMAFNSIGIYFKRKDV